jgi:hypothetical protein
MDGGSIEVRKVSQVLVHARGIDGQGGGIETHTTSDISLPF